MQRIDWALFVWQTSVDSPAVDVFWPMCLHIFVCCHVHVFELKLNIKKHISITTWDLPCIKEQILIRYGRSVSAIL